MSEVSRLRRLRLLTLMADEGEMTMDRVCVVGTTVAGMTGAGMMVMVGQGEARTVSRSDEISSALEQAQFEFGEGPCVDAYSSGFPVGEPDLARPSEERWPMFTGLALEVGARAVFGFPLQLGAVRLGALNLYRRRPGALSDEQHADAITVATIATETILLLQANAGPGELAGELAHGAHYDDVVHQAAGMVAVQMNVPIDQALVLLRARAFALERRVREVARDVVDRRLRLPGTTEEDP